MGVGGLDLWNIKTYYEAIKIKYLVLDHEQRGRSIESHRQSIKRHINSYTYSKGGISIFKMDLSINGIETTGQ